MTALSIQPPYPVFADTDGSPLENGYIWIGQANLDPQTNPIVVYWDEALTVPAAQPIRTLAGYPSWNGTPARLYAATNYSIRVLDAKGSLVYSAPDENGPLFGGTISSVDVTFLQAGTGAQERTVQSKLRDVVSVKDFGAVGDGIADDTAAIAACATACTAGKTIYFPQGTYLVSVSTIDTCIVLPNGVNLLMERGAWLTTNGTASSIIAPLGNNIITANIDCNGYPASGGVPGTWTRENAGIRCYFSPTIGLGAQNVVVCNSEIKNARYPVQIYGAKYWRVYGNRFHRFKQSGILAGFYSGYDCQYNIFSGNSFEDGGDYAIAFFQVGGQANGVGSHNVVANNVAKNMNQRTNGFAYGVEQGVTANQTNFLFANNIVQNTVTTGATGIGGIAVGNCTDSAVIGNVINLAYNSTADIGISVFGSVNTLIHGNQISNLRTTAIHVVSDCTKVTVSGNFLHNTGGTVSNYSPIIVGFTKGASDIAVVGNTLTVDSTHPHYGAGVPAIYCASGLEVGATISNVTIKDNVIINPNDQGIFLAGTAAIPAKNCSIIGNQILGTQDATFFKGESIYVNRADRLDVCNNVIADATIGMRLENVTTATIGENEIKGTVTLTYVWNFGSASTGMILRNNECTAPKTLVLAAGSDTTLTTPANNNRAVGGSGLVVQNRGLTGLIASGATVNHGLTVTPTNVVIAPADSGVTDFFVSALSATTFTITYGGGGTHAFYWRAEF